MTIKSNPVEVIHVASHLSNGVGKLWASEHLWPLRQTINLHVQAASGLHLKLMQWP